MSESLAQPILLAAGVYAAVGLAFAVAFAARGAARLDAGARNAPLGFRILILPGAAALWPLLALRWLRARAEAKP